MFNSLLAQQNDNQDCEFKPFEVYINDTDIYSNLRDAPNGDIVFKINNKLSDNSVLTVIGYKNGWFKVNEINGIYYNFTLSDVEVWIHQSIVDTAFTYSTDLLDKPKGKKVVTIPQETTGGFSILDMHCNWIKLKTKDGTGWVPSEKLCGSPVTTCP
ncbi:hypothetical protein BWZ20_04550 [Winogradskyella sp. J14-2]|nr:hypothetical protein BWZ20_04550 [Winogradskyella sp. J14-2]